MHFVSGYKDNLEINHKDGNKLNNHCTNLEWVSSSVNKIHRILMTNSYGCMKKLKSISGENSYEIITFNSTREAERAGYNRRLIRKAIKTQNLYKGYIWKYT